MSAAQPGAERQRYEVRIRGTLGPALASSFRPTVEKAATISGRTHLRFHTACELDLIDVFDVLRCNGVEVIDLRRRHDG